MSIDFRAGAEIAKAQFAEMIESGVESAARADEFVADMKLALQQGDQLERARAANNPVKPLKAPQKPPSIREARNVEKVNTAEEPDKDAELEKQAEEFAKEHPVLNKDDLKELSKKVEALKPRIQEFSKKISDSEAKVAKLTKDKASKADIDKAQGELKALKDESDALIIEAVTAKYGQNFEAQADYALDFLLSTSDDDLKSALQSAKDKFTQTFNREIVQSRAKETVGNLAHRLIGKEEPAYYYNLLNEIASEESSPLESYKKFRAQFATPEEQDQFTNRLLHCIGQELRTISFESSSVNDDSKKAATNGG